MDLNGSKLCRNDASSRGRRSQDLITKGSKSNSTEGETREISVCTSNCIYFKFSYGNKLLAFP